MSIFNFPCRPIAPGLYETDTGCFLTDSPPKQERKSLGGKPHTLHQSWSIFSTSTASQPAANGERGRPTRPTNRFSLGWKQDKPTETGKSSWSEMGENSLLAVSCCWAGNVKKRNLWCLRKRRRALYYETWTFSPWLSLLVEVIECPLAGFEFFVTEIVYLRN